MYPLDITNLFREFLGDFTMPFTGINDLSIQKKKSSKKPDRIKFIHQIQKSQGDFPCFKTAYSYFCDSSKCVWRQECQDRDRPDS